MSHSIIARFAFVCTVLSAAIAWADKDAPLKPATTPGKLVFEDDFNEDQLDSHWLTTKGLWQVASGTLVGSERVEDKHAAVLTLKQPNRDSELKFSFKLDGTKAFNLSFNHARGHLFRVVVRDDALVITKDKDKRDPKSKVEQLAKTNADFQPGRWYTMLVEIKGDEVTVQTDNGVRATAHDPRLDVDKTGYRFVTRGSSLVLDDVKVWSLDP